jgi:hypothetical protein
VKKKQFFRNFMTIMLFGAVGTMISFFTISIGRFFLNFNCLSYFKRIELHTGIV